MQLQALAIVKIGVTAGMALSLAACDASVSADDNDVGMDGAAKADSYVAPPSNPCVAGWVIDGIKGHIIDDAQDTIEANKGWDDLNQRLLASASITFNYISEPTYYPNDSVSCSAQANITYSGNDQTNPDALATLAEKIEQASFTGYMLGTGISAYNIDNYYDIHGNNFAVDVSYDVGSTYSESGEKSESYQANVDAPAAMLALVVMIDRVAQDKL